MIEIVIDARAGGAGLAACLDSVRFAAAVWVIDPLGDEALCRLAVEHGARVLDGDLQEALISGSFAPGLPWVLLLEESERVPRGLMAELELLPFHSGDEAGYRIGVRLSLGERALRRRPGEKHPLRLVRREWLVGRGGSDGRLAAEMLVGELESKLERQLMPAGVRGWLEEQSRRVDSEARRRVDGRLKAGETSFEAILKPIDATKAAEAGRNAGIRVRVRRKLASICGGIRGNVSRLSWVLPGVVAAPGPPSWGALVENPMGCWLRGLVAEGGWRDGRAGLAHAFLDGIHAFLVNLRVRELVEDLVAREAAEVGGGNGSAAPLSDRLWFSWIFGAGFLALAGSVFFFSWLPEPRISEQVHLPGHLGAWVDAKENWNLRTAVPFVLMGGLMGLWLQIREVPARTWWISWGGMVLIALIAEWGQLYLERRHCDAADVGWAAAGAAGGLVLMRCLGLAKAGFREVRGWLELAR